VDENVRAAGITLPDDLPRSIDDPLGSVVRYEHGGVCNTPLRLCALSCNHMGGEIDAG
jgi:hypothetical protein